MSCFFLHTIFGDFFLFQVYHKLWRKWEMEEKGKNYSIINFTKHKFNTWARSFYPNYMCLVCASLNFVEKFWFKDLLFLTIFLIFLSHIHIFQTKQTCFLPHLPVFFKKKIYHQTPHPLKNLLMLKLCQKIWKNWLKKQHNKF